MVFSRKPHPAARGYADEVTNGTLSVGALGGIHRAHETHLVGVLGSLFQVLSKLNPGDVGRDCFDRSAICFGSVRFRIESVDVGHAS